MLSCVYIINFYLIDLMIWTLSFCILKSSVLNTPIITFFMLKIWNKLNWNEWSLDLDLSDDVMNASTTTDYSAEFGK